MFITPPLYLWGVQFSWTFYIFKIKENKGMVDEEDLIRINNDRKNHWNHLFNCKCHSANIKMQTFINSTGRMFNCSQLCVFEIVWNALKGVDEEKN